MTHRHRALIALVLATALSAGGFAAAIAAKSPRERSTGSSSTTVRGGYLGVNLQDFSGELRQSYDYDGDGAVVSSVMPGSPADKIGIQEGDIITRFNNLSVTGADQLTRRVRSLGPNTMASIWVWRDGKEVDLGRVQLGDRSEQSIGDAWTAPRARRSARAPETPETPEAPRAPRTMRAPDAPDAPDAEDEDNNRDGEDEDDMQQMPHMMRGNVAPYMRALTMAGRGRLGVETRDLDSDLGEYFQTPDGRGVLVLGVVDGTPADKAGLKAGDVILSVDGDDVRNTEELRKEIRDKKAGPIELRVRRKGTERTIRAELEKPSQQGFLGNDMRNWMGWQNGDGDGKRVDRRVYRLDNDDFQGLSPEDRAQLRKDLEKLHKDMREMRREMRNQR